MNLTLLDFGDFMPFNVESEEVTKGIFSNIIRNMFFLTYMVTLDIFPIMFIYY